MTQDIRQLVADKMSKFGINIQPHDDLSTIILLTFCCLIAFITYVVVRWGLLKILNPMIKHSSSNLGEIIVHHKVLEKLSLTIPAIVVNLLIPLVLDKYILLSDLIDRILGVWLVIVLIRSSYAFLDATNDFADLKNLSKNMPIKSFVQLFKLIFFTIGFFIIISILANRSPIYFLSGLGVATGLVLLVFKDTILGFVAGIQLAANQMLQIGDWIQVDKYGANGSIIEISLTTIKVQNWDNTVTNIPAYALVQDSFINWRHMEESGGRRIKRSVLINIDSIYFISAQDEEKLAQIPLVADLIKKRKKELEKFPSATQMNRLTNITLFRAYLEEFLKQNINIRQDMTFLVRELDPTPQGLPIQIYIFTNDTRWVYYEGIQSDIFDHIYAILPQFGLTAFQAPASIDIRSLKAN
ncbi:mechanosensitive ion channel protein MscS [Mergibacter septicus]|uniref:Mechanosensitive ion channel protein MscS n=1 Tax=Mergibacter septicus TaxID=221402 RepID=A0A8D4J0K1_9PAST|nr:mechanosensitive ion channel family protein [Mergibacter septicus]AWX13815.1 mechanosensitive ion channel protein MscS [Mergibacter septicus]AWX15807.1 mechanosensitive ion channel protein MscS [Mergibacter septicus]QDJ15060.1 mechanosensitive ion channel protein MscS [Mergibacter septicus]UTU47517.1 mechanosensitive ion channel family protein [Mergibacter septicus]WMR95303.1 mechanosensitive ion channel family protein [Mergibacter septicus]